MGRHQKKGKKIHNSCELWGGQQILVCEPQKKFFPKNMLKSVHNVPLVCLYKIQSLNSFKIPDAGFHLYILPFKIM